MAYCGWQRINSAPCLGFGGLRIGLQNLNKMSSKAWERTKGKVRKAIKKVAVDLLKLYAQRAEQQGYAYPVDTPWQQELEDSFPYQPTPDQLKATQDMKRDMQSDRPMDRLVCGVVGFGKTEVAIRGIFKAVNAGKQGGFFGPDHNFDPAALPYPQGTVCPLSRPGGTASIGFAPWRSGDKFSSGWLRAS